MFSYVHSVPEYFVPRLHPHRLPVRCRCGPRSSDARAPPSRSPSFDRSGARVRRPFAHAVLATWWRMPCQARTRTAWILVQTASIHARMPLSTRANTCTRATVKQVDVGAGHPATCCKHELT